MTIWSESWGSSFESSAPGNAGRINEKAPDRTEPGYYHTMTMMQPCQEKGEVLAQETLGAGIYRLTIAAPQIAMAAKPGQFVMVRVGEVFDPLLRRPFSIHQATGNDHIQLLYKVVGRGTKILAGLDEGRTIDIVGPLGRPFPLEKGTKTCIVGGGMGVAPLFFAAKQLIKRAGADTLQILLGARTKAEIKEIAGNFRALGASVRIATDDGTMGHHGLVTDLLTEGIPPHDREWRILSCGPYPMLRAVAAITQRNGWACQVSLETMMACGVSACLGCALPKPGTEEGYIHVCKDGPVFDRDEVVWL